MKAMMGRRAGICGRNAVGGGERLRVIRGKDETERTSSEGAARVHELIRVPLQHVCARVPYS